MSSSNGHDRQTHSSTATSLVLRIQAADREAWQHLTELYGPLVYHWCRRMGLGDTDAPDVFQEVFVTVLRSVKEFDPSRKQGTFRGWLWAITRSKVLDHYRREHGRATGAGGTEAQRRLAELPDPFTDDSHDPADRSETSSLVHRALRLVRAEFEPRSWEAFWRSAVQQQHTSHIAADLGMTPAAVRQAKSRVLRRLRTTLGDRPA